MGIVYSPFSELKSCQKDFFIDVVDNFFASKTSDLVRKERSEYSKEIIILFQKRR